MGKKYTVICDCLEEDFPFLRQLSNAVPNINPNIINYFSKNKDAVDIFPLSLVESGEVVFRKDRKGSYMEDVLRAECKNKDAARQIVDITSQILGEYPDYDRFIYRD